MSQLSRIGTAVQSDHMSQDILPPRVRRWLFTTNHKEVGILYLVTALFFFVAAGLLALTMRTQLSVPDNHVLTETLYNQFVTVHGLLMIFWVLSPFAFGFANYIIPLQIGARDLAFPRLNAMSYWFYLFSGVAIIMSFIFGAPDLGWTLYSPQTAFQFAPSIGLNVGAAALILITVSITMSSVNFLVTMFKMRAPGMKLRNMPVFPWAILVTIFMMLYAFPSFLAAVLLLYVDRAFGTFYFSSLQGGALLWDNVFWFFGHPEVYIVLFPLGAIALFVIGGITGVYLASVALDHALRGTYFVVAHFHYIMVGGSIMGLIAGLYYWFPKFTGRMYNETVAKIHFIVSFIGFNILYFPMFLLLDMPRRIQP